MHVSGDIPDFFSRLLLPEAMWPWSILGGITAKELSAYMEAARTPVTLERGQIHLAAKVLVMGWSWAPYLAHITLIILDQEFGMSARLSRVIYGAPTPQLRRAPEHEFGEDLISWTYIDDYGAAATSRNAPGEAPGCLAYGADRARAAFKKVGLPVHKLPKASKR